ncbi:unnamed protein product [Trichobilharzia regenti]|nr:unnamed protein product [Trichobilharzia regenti]
MSEFHKVILCPGTQKPKEHERVVVNISIIVDDSTILRNQKITFDVGHAEDFGVMKVVDEIVKEMGCGEQCDVSLTHDYSFTDLEKEFLKINDSFTHKVLFSVHLQDIQKMSESEKFVVADVMKRRGNKLLKMGMIIRAFNCYKRAIKILDGSVSVTDPNYRHDSDLLGLQPCDLSPRQLLAVALSNAALCLMKLGTAHNYSVKKSQSNFLTTAIKCCERAIELEPKYVKAWFRMAKTHAVLGNYEEAIAAGEKYLSCLEDESSCQPKWVDINEVTKANASKQMEKSLSEWRTSLANEETAERATVRKRTVQWYSSFGDMYYDEWDEIEKLPISVWSNDLAQNMMSLHEELEAFGEKMPEFKTSRTKGKSRLATIQSEDTDAEDCLQNDM